MDLMNKEPKRVRSFQKVVSRALESLVTLRSLSTENGKGGQGGRALGYGVVDFEGNTNQSPFVRVRGKVFRDDLYMDSLIKFIVKNLGIRPPRLVVSVLGSDVDDAGVTDPRLNTVLKSAMLESPDVWIITDGRNAGVSKLIAGIMDEIRSARQEEYTVPVIGIVPWKSLTTESDKRKSKSKVLAQQADRRQQEKHTLFTEQGNYIKYDPTEPQHLNFNHTLYIFVDGDDTNSDLQFRRHFIARVRKIPFSDLTKFRRDHLCHDDKVGNIPDNTIQKKKSKMVGKRMSRRDSYIAEVRSRQAIRSQMSHDNHGAHAQEFDDANQHDHFLEGTTQIGTLEMVIGGKANKRNLELVSSAVINDTLSPILIVKGTGGFADLLSYANLFLHDNSPESEGSNARVLDAKVRKEFQVYSGEMVNEYQTAIADVVAVERKIVNFDLDSSDLDDLDQAMLQALVNTMAADEVSADIAEEDATQSEESGNHELRSRYELHLNMLRYAIGFDRVEEAVEQMEKVEFIYEQMHEKVLTIVHAEGTSAGKSVVEETMMRGRIQREHEALFGIKDDDNDHYLMLPDHYKLALEWALTDNRVELVKVLVPKVCEQGQDIADFLYGPNETRPGEGYGTTLAELYEYESSSTETKRYLEPILRLEHDVDENMPDFFKSNPEMKKKWSSMPQVHNNIRVRKIWSMVMGFLKGDENFESPIHTFDGQGKKYQWLDFIAIKDGFYPEDDHSPDPKVWCGVRDISRRIFEKMEPKNAQTGVEPSPKCQAKIDEALAKDRTLESMYFLLLNKGSEDRDLIAYQELTIWAAVMNRSELAEYFWQMGGHAIANALMASTVYAGIANHPAIAHKGKLADTVQQMRDMSDLFEHYAIGVMGCCYKEEPEMAQDVLEAKLVTYDWLNNQDDKFDCLELAELAENLEFISHPCCQAVIERKWTGGKSPGERRKRGELDNRFWARLKRKSTAPQAKFYLDLVAYITLVILTTVVALDSIERDITATEWLVFVWYGFLFLEEGRQLLSEDGPVLESAREYWNDNWNKLDILCYSTYFASFALRASNPDDPGVLRQAKALLGLTVIMVYYRLLRYLEASRDIGPKLLIFQQLFKALTHYLLILFVFIISYGIYVQTVLNPFVPLSSMYFLDTVYRVVYRPYFQVYGELMLDDLNEGTQCNGKYTAFSDCHSWVESMLPIVLGGYLIITSVMIMNMLIADFTRTFDNVFEISNSVWKMSMFKLLKEYETRTLVPPPFNAPYVIYKIFAESFGYLWEGVCGCTKSTIEHTALAAEEHLQIVEVFQDRLADDYLDRQLADREAGGQLSRIETLLHKGLKELDYFKARQVSSSLRSEMKRSAPARNDSRQAADGRHGRPRSDTNSKLEASKVIGDVEHVTTAVGCATCTNGRAMDVLRYSAASVGEPLSVCHPTAMWRFVKHFDSPGYYREAPGGDGGTPNPFSFVYAQFYDLWLKLHPDKPVPIENTTMLKWNTMQSCSHSSGVPRPYLRPGENRLILHVVTRWKRDDAGLRIERLGKPMMEFVALKRKPTSAHWMLPEMLGTSYFSDANWLMQRGFRASPAYLLAFHNENLKYDITEQQRKQIDNEILRFCETHAEPPPPTQQGKLAADYDGFDEPSRTTPTAPKWDAEADPHREKLRVAQPLFDGFIDDHRNTGAAFCRAEVYHFHDNGNLFEAFDLKYPGQIHGEKYSEVAWLTLHSSIDLIGEQEEVLRNVAFEQGAFW
jgi:hypothetical protein